MRSRYHHRAESDSVWRGDVRTGSRFMSEGPERRHRIVDHERTSHHHRRSGYRRDVHSRRFQRSPSPRRETDIFVEAGRLAADYLVATGKLLLDSGSRKWRTVDSRESSWSTVDSRASAHSGSVKHALDSGSGGTRNSDEYDSRGSETFDRERGRSGSLSFDGSKKDKELGKSGSWNERTGSSSDRNVDGDDSSAGHYKQSLEKNGKAGTQNSSPGEITICGSASLLESDLEKCNPVKVGTESFFHNKKNPTLDISVKLECTSEDTNGSIQESGAVKNDGNKNDLPHLGQTIASERDVPKVESLTSSGIANVSTGTQSSLSKGSDSVHDYMNQNDNTSNQENSEAPGVNNDIDIPTGNLDSVTEDRMQITEGGKRALAGDNSDRESSKRHRGWFPSMQTHSGVSTPYGSIYYALPTQEPITSEGIYAYPSHGQKGSNISLIPIGHAKSYGNLEDPFPGPFKNFDLNLNLPGTSDTNENHDIDDPAIFNPDVEMRKEVPTMNIGLSMSNLKHSVNADGIEIIDLEDEPPHEDQRFNETNIRIQEDYGLVTSASGDVDPPRSSVTTDFDSSRDNMSLSNGEEIHGNEDSVQISPGELPSGLPAFWKKPNLDYLNSF